MNVAIILDSLIGVGGASRQALCLAHALQKKNNDVTLYTFYHEPGDYDEMYKGLKIVSLFQTKKEWQSAISPSFAWGPLHSLVQDIFTYPRAYRQLSKKIALDTDIINTHDKAYPAGLEFKRKQNKPVIAMINDLPLYEWNQIRFEKRVTILNNIVRKLLDMLIKARLKKLDHIVVLDNLNANTLYRLSGLKSTVVRSGLDFSAFTSEKSRSLNYNQPLKILCFGILMEHRRFEDAIEAMTILINRGIAATLTIAGSYETSSDYKQKLDELINKNKLSGVVKFAGKVSEREILSIYETHDVFIFPNHWQTWGLVVFEAMAAKLPVIVSKTCGASEMIIDGENGLLIEPKSPQHIADQIEKIYRDKNLYNSISDNGHSFVKDNISWDNYARDMLKIFTLYHV